MFGRPSFCGVFYCGLIVSVALSASCALFEDFSEVPLRDAGDPVAFGDASDVEMIGADSSDMPYDSERDLESDDPFSGRVSDGLSILFTFSSPTEPFRDESGVEPLLVMMDRNGFERLPDRNGVQLNPSQLVVSTTPPAKFYDAVRTTEAFTLELWVRPDSLTQGGPARVVTFSNDAFGANLTVGQGRTGLESDEVTVRVRNILSTESATKRLWGSPSWHVDNFQDAETQYVVTFSDGVLRFYRDGIERGSQARPVDFSEWDDTYHLAIGNEVNDSRPWSGEVYLVAAYDRALSQPEIFQNFEVGARSRR